MLLGLPEDKKIIEGILMRWFDYAECETYLEVKETLRELEKAGLKIGIISGAYRKTSPLFWKKRTFIRKFFDIIIGVNTIKKTKPHPDVFKYTLSKLNIP